MRGLLTADLHIHPHRALATTVDGMNSRLKDGLNVLDQMIDVVNDNDLDFVAIAGDLFETSPPFAEAYNGLSHKLTALGQIANVYLIAGNHDFRNIYYTGDQMDIPFLDYNRISGVKVLGTPSTHADLGEGLTIAGFHHQHVDSLMSALRDAEPANILLLHQMVAGASNDAGFRFPEGLQFDAETLSKFGLIVCGDIHKPQNLRPGFLIPGAPMHLNFGDESDRYFWVWADGVLEKVETKSRKFVTVVKEDEVTDDGNFYRIDTRKDKQLERLKLPEAAEAISDYAKQKGGEEYLEFVSEITNEIRITPIVPSDFVLDTMELSEFGPFEKVNITIGNGLHMILGECLEDGEVKDADGNSNGAGKSTLFEGISWILYGKTAKGIKAAAVMRRNRKRGKKCYGTLVFRSETRGELIVTRTQTEKGGKLTIELAGKPYTGRTKDTQKDIVELLGVTYEFFRQMVYFGQEAAQFFSQMGDADMKQMLSCLIGLEWYIAALKEVKARHEKVSTELQIHRADIERILAGASIIARQVRSFKTQISDWNSQRGVRHGEALVLVDDLLEQLETAKKEVEGGLADFDKSVKEEWANIDARHEVELENYVAGIEEQFGSRRELIKNQIDTYSNQLDSAKKTVATLPAAKDQADKVTTLEGELEELQKDQQDKLAALAAARQSAKTLSADRDKKQRVLSGAEGIETGARCSTCGSKVTEDTKSEYLVHLEEELSLVMSNIKMKSLEVSSLNEVWAGVNESVASMNATLPKERKKLVAIESFIKDVSTAEDKLNTAQKSLLVLDKDQEEAIGRQEHEVMSRHTAERKRFEAEVARRRESAVGTYQQKVKSLEQQVASAQTRAEEIEKEVCPYDAQLESSKSSMATFIKDQADIEAEISKLEKQLTAWAFWIKGFGREGIPAALLDGFCSRFTDEANALLSSLNTGMRVKLSPSTTIKSGEVRDRLDYTITTRTGESSYEQLSGGEKVRIDVVSMLTLHAMAATQYTIHDGLFGILILDEVFSALDPAGCEIVYQMLESFCARAVYVISHNDVMKALFRDFLTVRKVEDSSQVIAA